MLSRAIRQVAVKGARMASTKRSSINGPGAFETAYQVFMKNNVTYVGTILVAAIVVEGVFGTVTNGIWESSNRGVRLCLRYVVLSLCTNWVGRGADDCVVRICPILVVHTSIHRVNVCMDTLCRSLLSYAWLIPAPVPPHRLESIQGRR